MSTKTKSKKSSKSRTATKVAKKPSKQKTKTTKTKTKKKSCSCKVPGPILPPSYDARENEDGYFEYPNISDEYPISKDGFDVFGEKSVVTKYYYVVNHETKSKYVISGWELSFPMAKIIAEQATESENIYIVKIASPIAWLLNKVFKVEKIDANDILTGAIESL